jgi:hypothetical protein
MNIVNKIILTSDFHNFFTGEFDVALSNKISIYNGKYDLEFLNVDTKNLLELEQFVHDIITYLNIKTYRDDKGE